MIAGVAREQRAQAGGALLGRVEDPLLAGDVLPRDAGGLEAVAPAREPCGGDGVGGGGLALGRQRAAVAVVGGAEGDDPDPAVPERREVRRGQARAGAVVDADEGVLARARLVDHDERQAALDRGGEVGVVDGQRVGAEAGDDRLADGLLALAAAMGRARAAGEAREQQQREPGLLGGAREALQEQHGARIVERVGERLREQQADRLAPAGAQAPGGGVGPGVAELGRRGQDPLAQLGRELVRAVVGVGDRGARDAEVLGDASGGSPCAPRAPS